MSKDLLVIGPGHLGGRVATLWKQRFPAAAVTLKAHRQDPEREAKWRSLGFIPYKEGGSGYKYVLFSAPPGTDGEKYAEAVEDAVGKYTCGMTDAVSFVFTSSGGVYAENSGGMVDEESAVVSSKEPGNTMTRVAAILRAEKAVLEYPGGIVLRLGGLYTLTRGPHHFWLSGKIRESPSSPNGLINLLHYDDAAEAVMSAFKEEQKQEVFLVADGHALSRLEICNAALVNKVYSGASIPNFRGGGCSSGGGAGGQKEEEATTATALIDGKRYNVAKVRSRLQWSPKFAHFSSFMAQDYVEEMKVGCWLSE